MKAALKQFLKWTFVLLATSSWLLPNVSAYSPATYRRLVSDAWNVLVYLEQNPGLLSQIPGPPPNPAAQLTQERITQSLNFYRNKRSEFPPANGRWTSDAVTSNPGAELLGAFITSPQREYWREEEPTDADNAPFNPGGIFGVSCLTLVTNTPAGTPTNICEQTGNLLGWWAANVDDLHDTQGSFKIQYAIRLETGRRLSRALHYYGHGLLPGPKFLPDPRAVSGFP